MIDNTISDISIVLGAGAGGAVLGLSTLSFTDEPRRHLKNVLIGASIGIIIGVAIVAWGQATKTQDQYSSERKNIFINNDYYTGSETKYFNSSERIAWHKSSESESFSNSRHNTKDNFEKKSNIFFETIIFNKTF